MILGSKQRETELISRKRNMSIRRNSLLLHFKQYKNCCWTAYFFRKWTSTFYCSMITDHDEYLPTTNFKQTSLNKPMNKLKLFTKIIVIIIIIIIVNIIITTTIITFVIITIIIIIIIIINNISSLLNVDVS